MAETHDRAVQGEAGRQARLRLPGGGGAGRVAERIRRAARSRYAALALVAFFFGTSAAWIHNTASHHIQGPHLDENHTLLKGVQDLVPPPEGSNARVGEINRWFARLLYPGGVYYMNKRMGAGADMAKKRGWEQHRFYYPGGYYLQRHFTNTGAISWDPNLQDFTFFMRVAFNLIAVGCFCLALWTLCGRFGFPAAAVYGSLVLGSSLVFDQLHRFYTETTMFIVFNLAAALYVRYGLSRPVPLSLRIAAWLGALSAAALSVKLTGFTIAAMLAGVLIAGLWKHRQRLNPLPRIEVCVLSFLAFAYLVNVPFAPSWRHFVDDTLHNVWHFAGRHSLGPERFPFRPLEDGAGAVELLSSVPGIGWLAPLGFLAGLLWLASPPRRAMVPVYALGAAVVLAVWSFSNQRIYLDRNFASLYVAMSFVAAVAVGDLLERLPGKRKGLAAACAAPALLLAFLGTGAHRLWQTAPPKESFLEHVRDTYHEAAQCDSVAAIGLGGGDVRTLREIAGAEVAAFPRVPRFFHPDTMTYRDFRKNVFEKYHEYECLVVYREDDTNTKQATNFFGPKYYKLRKRIGNWFFFSVRPPAPGNLGAVGADGSLVLSWTAPFGPETVRLRSGPKPGGGTPDYQFRLQADGEPWEDVPWRDVPGGGRGRAGELNRVVLRDLDLGNDGSGSGHRVQLRARYPDGFGASGPPAEVPVKPRERS